MAKRAYHRPTTLSEAWSNPRYPGKIDRTKVPPLMGRLGFLRPLK